MNNYRQIFSAFLTIEPDFNTKIIQSGHINQTFLVKNGGLRYILQRINNVVFTNARQIMINIDLVAKHLAQKKYPHPILKPFKTLDGHFLKNDEWRLFPYFEDTIGFERVKSAKQTYAAASFLSEFYSFMADADLSGIRESIPGFLDFNQREEQFIKSLKTASKTRLVQAKTTISRLKNYNYILNNWNRVAPDMPARLIHADPKISNFLFAKDDFEKPVALIDWDTFMMGPLLYDFGDMVRSYTNLRDEDDPHEGNNFSNENYDALQRGFISAIKNKISPLERNNMGLAAQLVIYIQAARFLTDYLNNDAYYTVHRPNQNLDRTIGQLNLLDSLTAYLGNK